MNPKKTRKLILFINKSLDKAQRKYDRRLRVCKSEFSELTVHNSRIIMRSFISFLELLSSIFPNEYNNKLTKVLRKQMKLFASLRDVQVQILKVEELRRKFPALNQYYYHLIKIEQQQIKHIDSQLRFLSTETIYIYSFFLKVKINNEMPATEMYMDNLWEKVREVYNELLAVNEKVVFENTESIHDVRLVFKRFRYMLEHLKKKGKLTSDDIYSLKQFQTIMGLIQDEDVLYASIKDFVSKQDEVLKGPFLSVIEYLELEMDQLKEKFMNKRSEIQKFERFIKSHDKN